MTKLRPLMTCHPSHVTAPMIIIQTTMPAIKLLGASEVVKRHHARRNDHFSHDIFQRSVVAAVDMDQSIKK
jgi:hypothetical protein